MPLKNNTNRGDPVNPVEIMSLALAAGTCHGCVHFDAAHVVTCENGALSGHPCPYFKAENFYFDRRRGRFWCRERREIDVVSAALAADICPGCAEFDTHVERCSTGALAERPCRLFSPSNFYYDRGLHRFWCHNWKGKAPPSE